MPSEKLQFDDLAQYLLLKNGNFLYKVPFRDGWAVLKVYYGSRGFWGRVRKSWDNIMAGQSSYMPKTRLRIERECLALWKQHGIRVFDIYPDVEVAAPQCPPGGYMLFEYVDRPKLVEVLQDETRSLEERFEIYRGFLKDWSRRHAIAIAEKEPRLVHENGDGKHVMILEDGGYLWFDFEMIWRSRERVVQHVAHEINQYLWFLMRNTPAAIRDQLIAETVQHYPDAARLAEPYNFFFKHPNPAHRFGRALERRFKARAKAPDSKYNVALSLKVALENT